MCVDLCCDRLTVPDVMLTVRSDGDLTEKKGICVMLQFCVSPAVVETSRDLLGKHTNFTNEEKR